MVKFSLVEHIHACEKLVRPSDPEKIGIEPRSAFANDKRLKITGITRRREAFADDWHNPATSSKLRYLSIVLYLPVLS